MGGADDAYQKKVAQVKPEPENWNEWSAWNWPRFLYLTWARVFPLSRHWLLNLASGLLNQKGVTFSEFLVSTALGALAAIVMFFFGSHHLYTGSIPSIFLAVKVGALQHHYSVTELMTWPWVKWPLIGCCMIVPGLINKSGFLEKYTKQKEIGWDSEDARILREHRSS